MTAELEAPKDRPVGTFAHFAYNQEKYIREAIEGDPQCIWAAFRRAKPATAEQLDKVLVDMFGDPLAGLSSYVYKCLSFRRKFGIFLEHLGII